MNIDRRWYAVLAVILFGSICYFIGRTNGRTDEKLAQNTVQTQASDSTTKTVQIRTDSAKKKDEVLLAAHDLIRTKIRVVHDTIYAPSDSTDEAIYSPAIAQLIASDDSLISAQKRTIALQDTLISSLRVGINLRDQRIKLLEKAVLPSKASRFIAATRYVAIGALVGVAWARR